MIPFDYVTEWRAEAPWIDDAQVEQDLVISRALVEIFRHPALADSLALRGGTALSKLQLRPPARYSEDIDLVQTTAQPAGPMMNALRAVLEPWLGKPKWKQAEGRITFYFRYTAEGASPVPMRLKVETNTREHFALPGIYWLVVDPNECTGMCPEEYALIAIGAVVGAVIDLAIKRRVTVYEAEEWSDRAKSIAIGPILTRDRQGLRVAVRF